MNKINVIYILNNIKNLYYETIRIIIKIIKLKNYLNNNNKVYGNNIKLYERPSINNIIFKGRHLI